MRVGLFCLMVLGMAACGGGGPESPVVAPGVSNAQIVFQSQSPVPTDPAAVNELVTMNIDGSERSQITHDGKNKFLPHFSRDGTRLVYSKFLTGRYDDPRAQTDVAIHDFASGTETLLTHTGTSFQPAWSPDGERIAFGTRAGDSLWIMNADGSDAHLLGAPSGALDDLRWGDFAWSSDDWILFTVAENTDDCFKARLDKIRPDGTARTKVTDGGPNCTPDGMEQSGDADPGFSADGTRVLLFRACFGATPANGIFVTDTAGSYRTKIADGFGPDWNPAAE